ncbi:MAG TPA: hypothetical protein VK252_07710 [Solirubrobacteraceae bacterium]|nr:hypothetical protein [Solirubrobacteraceae bacterium]
MSCDRHIREGSVCTLAENHADLCVDTVSETNNCPETTAEVDKFFGELDAACAVAFHVAGIKAQSYSGAGVGVFDAFGDERDFDEESPSASAKLYATLNSRRHMRAVEQLETVYQTIVRVPWTERQLLRTAFTPRRWRAHGDSESLRQSLTFGRGTVTLSEPFDPRSVERTRVCLLPFAVETSREPMRVLENFAKIQRAIDERKDVVGNLRLLSKTKVSSWQRLLPALMAYDEIRVERVRIEKVLHGREGAKRRASERAAELQSQRQRIRVKVPRPPPVFSEEEASALRDMARSIAEEGRP